MTQSADMRRESGTCNVCAAPCSSCMHLNHALMGSKTDEFTDENCRLVEANQYSMDEGDVSSLRSRACESLQHAVSETSNMLSVNSSHDSLSENADSRRSLSNNYQDSKCLEVLDDNTSCLSRASEATLVDGRHYRNADRINLSCSSTSVSRLGAEGSGSAQSIDMSSLSEIPSCKDVNTDRSSPKVQSPCTQSQSGKSLSSIPSIMDLERDSCSHIPEKLSECSLENIDQSLTKEAAPTVVSGEKSLTDKNSLIDSTAKVSVKVYLNSEADTVNDVGDATDETRKCSVSGKQDERSEELVESPEADMQEHQSEDGSDESDVVEHDVKVCDICGDAGREDLLAICSRCSDGAEHTYCMREMLQKVPEGDWLCEECKYAGETENHRLEETENQRLDKSEIMPGIEKEETENQRLGKSEVMPGIEKDVEERKLHKVGSTSQIAGKRHSENIEIAPAAKRQAVESSTRSPKASSPKRLVSLSRESSFKSPDKGKVKPGNQLSFRSHSSGDDMEVARSPSNGPRGQMPKGTLLKSNSFSTLNSKPRVKLVDEVVTQKQKGAAEHTSKNMETPARMISKSMSFKSTNLGRSSATESKVKMLSSKSTHAQDLKGSRLAKEWGAVDRKSLSRVDRPPVCSTMSSSVVSTPKGDQKLTPRSETSKPLSGNNRELKVNQDGKSSSLSKSASSVGRKGVEPPVSSERTSINVDETLQDLLPRSRETTNQVEKNRESSSDRMRPGVNTAPKSTFCPKCKESGHSTECCSVGCTPESGIEVSATRSSKEEMHKGNRLKAAINAALLRRPEICKKKEVPNQTGGFSTSGTDLNCEAISQDQLLASSTPKNSVSAEVTHEGQENLESSTSETSKCSSVNDVKQLNACPIDSCPQLEDSDSVGPAGKSPVRDLSNEALAISNVLSTMPAIPEYDYIWQGILEVHRGGKPPDLFAGIQAHLSACASPKVLEVVNKFSPKVSLNEVPRLSTWPSQFNQGGAKEDNVALYFFAKDVESYERHYKGLLDQMIRNDLALKGIFDGVELLIFPSNQLPEKSQRWNMLFFLWGVFRGRRMNNSDSAEKICIPSLNMPVEKDFPTAVMTLSETRCSPKRMDEDSINCDRTSSMVLASTSVDQSHVTLARNSDIKEIDLEQMHLGSQVNLQKQDSRFNTKSTLTLPTSSAQLCQEMKSPGSSLNGSLLEDGPDRESKISLEAMGTSATSRIMETKTDCDISVKEENSSSGNEEIGAARIITEDKMSERMNRVKDLERPKRKQREDDRFIDIEAAIEEDLTIEGVNCWQPTDKNLIDPSGTVFQASGITCQRMPWNEVNSKLEDGESSSKKLKTGFGGIYGGRDILNGSFVSFANDLGSCSSVEDKGCVEACDEKIIREDLGTMERTFFPVDAHNKNDFQLRENSCPQKGPNEHEDQFRDGIPNLELALGGDTKPPHKGMLPFFVGVVDKKNNQGKRRDGLTDEQEDDGVAASLSLSLSFPSSNKERVKPVSKAEQLLPDGHRVNTSLLLFGSFSDK